MARFVPPLDPATLKNNGERAVAQALAGLPDRFVIYHGFLFLERERSRSGREYFREGEIDFVVFDRHAGVLVLEVKGGRISYDPQRKTFRREETGPLGNPFEQARDNMHALVDRIGEQPEFRNKGTPYVRGYAVVLPHCNWTGALPADVQPEVLLGFDDLPSLEKRVETLLGLWSRRDNIEPLEDWCVKGIQGALQSALSLLPVMAATLTDQEDRLRRATDEQARVLECMRTMPRVAFDGVAGSGKTLLALSQAQTFGRAGRRTLLVCYNRPLADWLGEQLPGGLRGLVHISTYHSLCQTTCQRTGIPFQIKQNDPDFWTYEAAEKLEQAAKKLPEEDRFDAIVVDEGQDFPSVWFPSLRLLSKTQDDNFPLYWFHDPRQNLFLSEDLTALPPNMAGPFQLTRNCRNTRRIGQHCGSIINQELQAFDGVPEGEEIRQERENSTRDVIETARKQVLDWTDRGGRLKPQQIVILTPRVAEGWPPRFGFIPLCDNFDRWRRGECILLSTLRRFKGLEADAIILADVPARKGRPYFTPADSYVACSRAKHLLTVIECRVS